MSIVNGVELPSLSTLATAVVSVESQLSCSVASVGPTGVTANPAAVVPLLDAGLVVVPADSDGASDSEVAFVHWRAFFYSEGTRFKDGFSSTTVFLLL